MKGPAGFIEQAYALKCESSRLVGDSPTNCQQRRSFPIDFDAAEVRLD